MLKQKINIQRLTIAGLLVAAGVILPYATSHSFGVKGTIFLPMHIPVLLMGLLCGPMYGAMGGGLIPFLSTVMTGMPAMFPTLPMMVCELVAYGLVSGLLLYKTKLGGYKYGVYPALIIALFSGRAVYMGVFYIFSLFIADLKFLAIFQTFATGLPGVAVQLVFIPPIVKIIEKSPKQHKCAVRLSALSLIERGAGCVVIKDGKIVKVKNERGVSPVMELYESGELKGAYVVDKIIGRAAAMLLILGGAEGCYGVVMSKGAKELLKTHGIGAGYETLAEFIQNRSGDGVCPMETAVKNISDPKDGYTALKKALESIKGE